MSTWHSVFWSPSKHRWLVRIGQDGRSQRQMTVPVDVAAGPRAKKAAEQWAREQFEAKAIKDDAPPAPKTLAELAPHALTLWAGDDRLAPKTRYDRESFVRRCIIPEFGALPIETIDVPRVRAWVRTMRKRGDARSSIGNRLSALSTLLSDLHAEGHGPDNRAATSKAVLDELPSPKKRAPVALSPSALEALFNDAETPAWFALVAGLAGLAGLEAGAALGLEIRDVKIVDGVAIALTVRQSIAMLGANGHASIGPTKNEHRGTEDHPRIIPVHPALAHMIGRWLHVERERWCCSKGHPNALLVPNSTGKPWRPKVAKRLRKELLRIGVATPKGLVFHSLRGCFLTWLAVAGVPKDVRQRLAGHAGDVEALHYEQASQLFETDRAAVALITVSAVPNAVPLPHDSAHQTFDDASDHGATFESRTRDLRFTKALPLCTHRPFSAAHGAETDLCGPIANGTEKGNGSEFEPAVPNAVHGLSEHLRWMTLSFDAADAMLVGLEAL